MSEIIKLSGAEEEFSVYKTEPSGEIKGGVIVIHEVWGLNDHTKDIADRFASAGYLALAPDLIGEASPEPELAKKLQAGLFNPDPEKRTEIQPKLRELMAPVKAPGFAESTIKKLKSCFEYLSSQPGVENNIASVGFCFGGTYSFSLAVHEPRLKAAIPFYGHADFNTQELKQISCPIFAFYGENDKALVDSLPDLESKMKDVNVDFSSHVYPDCGHAFFNDTNPYAYNEAAARDAWDKTISFLADKLKKD